MTGVPNYVRNQRFSTIAVKLWGRKGLVANIEVKGVNCNGKISSRGQQVLEGDIEKGTR